MSLKTLHKFASLQQSCLEKSEKVELLRWIENGHKVVPCIVDVKTISVDTPEDLVMVISKINNNN